MKVYSKRLFQYGYPWCCWLHAANCASGCQLPAADGLLPVSNTSVQEPAQVHDPVVFQNSTSLPSTDSLQTELIDVYKQTSPSVVYIIAATGSGSGFVYDAKGDIITNSHVVAGSCAFESCLPTVSGRAPVWWLPVRMQTWL